MDYKGTVRRTFDNRPKTAEFENLNIGISESQNELKFREVNFFLVVKI